MSADWHEARAGLSEYVLMDDFEALHGVMLDRDSTVKQMRETLLKELASLREIAVAAEIARRNHGERPWPVARFIVLHPCVPDRQAAARSPEYRSLAAADTA